MSVLRVNRITDEAGTGPVEFTKGVTFPASQSFTQTDLKVNTTGICTFSSLLGTNVHVATVITATSFRGNGFNITNAPGTPAGKVIGLHLIT